MTHKVSIIPQAVLDVVDADARKMLAPAVERSGGRHTVDSVMASIYGGYNALWFAFNDDGKSVGALVTEIETYPNRTMLNLIFCAGDDLEDWHEEMLDILEKYGRDNGCDGMELIGRYGWKKFLQKHGWEASYLVCQMSFDKEEEKRDAA